MINNKQTINTTTTENKIFLTEINKVSEFWIKNGLKPPYRIKLILGFAQTILLCVVGELAGGGSVAVDISDI